MARRSTETTEEPSYFRSTATISQNPGTNSLITAIVMVVEGGKFPDKTRGMCSEKGCKLTNTLSEHIPRVLSGNFSCFHHHYDCRDKRICPWIFGKSLRCFEIRWLFSCLRASSHPGRTSYYVIVAEPVIVRFVSFGWGVSFPTPFRNTFPEFYRGIFPPSTTITIAVISEFVPGFLGNRCSASEIRWFFSCLRASSSHPERTSCYVMVAEPVIVLFVSFGW
ncbi:hypothetical protein CEXT_596501 [Caerostris extrusa]|uniref:Uncharacterized protein n=1 Tax=Caerostris extrusa TaxID=172846 RepID=A0AAV4W8K2_CAEEX|nr:hypothetical protein CEXT_596501 [Caerostris extrusa]